MNNAKLAAVVLMIGFVITGVANAEVEKVARPGESGIDLAWWPRLSPVNGWQHDDEASWQIGANVLLQKGTTFADAPAILYAMAAYKPRSDSKTLKEFISQDQAEFASRGVRASHIDSIVDGDGNRLITYSFAPTGKVGDWEIIAYGEEGEFFLVFALSAHGAEALAKAMPAFRAMVGSYQAVPGKRQRPN